MVRNDLVLDKGGKEDEGVGSKAILGREMQAEWCVGSSGKWGVVVEGKITELRVVGGLITEGLDCRTKESACWPQDVNGQIQPSIQLGRGVCSAAGTWHRQEPGKVTARRKSTVWKKVIYIH